MKLVPVQLLVRGPKHCKIAFHLIVIVILFTTILYALTWGCTCRRIRQLHSAWCKLGKASLKNMRSNDVKTCNFKGNHNFFNVVLFLSETEEENVYFLVITYEKY